MDGKLDALTLAERLECEQREYWLHFETASSLDKYPAKQHARRVQEKLGTEHGLIYLPGEPARNNEDSDMPAPFRQRRYFYYLSGCNEPNCHLTYDMENDSLALFIPRIDPSRVIWNGRGSTPAEALAKYDIDQVFYIDQLQDFLQDWAKFSCGDLYILHQAQNPLVPGMHDSVDFEALLPAINLARLVKDEHEIALIRKANDISSYAHKKVLANIQRFKNEAQVEGLFLDVCVSRRAKQQAYDPIVASGPNAGTLHYDDNDQDFDNRQLMCLDAGCEWDLYASDITRTFPLSGKWPSEEAKNIYQLVQRMQETCIEGLKPGVRYLDLHILAHQIAIDGLLSLGILHNGSREEIYKAGTSKAFFPHGLGHHVGLEVHDPGQADLMSMMKGNPKYEMAPSIFPKDFHLPVYDPETCRSPVDVLSGHLEEGMVLTVEPGIYFSTYALKMFYLPSPIHSKYINTSVVARYLPVGGVRIEDNLLITSKGYENLTTAPKGEAMLEIIRSQNAQWPFVSDSSNLGPSSTIEQGQPLVRAPGFPRHTPEPVLKPIVRSSTAPVKRRPDSQSADTVDFEPFDGPSLFSNFKLKRASTTDDNVKRWREARERSAPKPQNTVCGECSTDVAHAYMGFPSDDGHLYGAAPWPHSEKKPACRKCTVLVQTLHRLRDNLNKSDPSSLTPTPRVAPVATRKSLEMEQLGRFAPASPVIRSPDQLKRKLSQVLRGHEVKIPIRAKPINKPVLPELVANGDALESFDFEAFLNVREEDTLKPLKETPAPRLNEAHTRAVLACRDCHRAKIKCDTTSTDMKCTNCIHHERECVYFEYDAAGRVVLYSGAPVPRPSLSVPQHVPTARETAKDAKTSTRATVTLPVFTDTTLKRPFCQRLLPNTLLAMSPQAAEYHQLACEHCRRTNVKCVRWSLSAPCTACVGAGRTCGDVDTTFPPLPARVPELEAISLPRPSPSAGTSVAPKSDNIRLCTVCRGDCLPCRLISPGVHSCKSCTRDNLSSEVLKKAKAPELSLPGRSTPPQPPVQIEFPNANWHAVPASPIAPGAAPFSPTRHAHSPPSPPLLHGEYRPEGIPARTVHNSSPSALPAAARPTASAAAVPKSADQLSCIACYMRRTRCDRVSPTGPCETCTRNGFLCDFQIPYKKVTIVRE